MNIHQNARLTPLGRERLVRLIESGMSLSEAGAVCGCSAKTAAKWRRRYEQEGREGLQDRSSRPHVCRKPTPDAVSEQIIALRCQRLTGAHIAQKTGVSPATVSRVLRRAGLSRMRDLEPSDPVRRYERDAPGDLIHLDVKRLGRFSKTGHRITGDPRQGKSAGAGWEFVHVCIDDHSRLSFTQIHSDERGPSAVAHLRAAVTWYASMGITVRRVMTDNGSCYISHAFKAACTELGIRHIRTKPYTPKTNGKAPSRQIWLCQIACRAVERFIQTALREWAYARAYDTSDQRADDLPRWTHLYNWHRPHSAIGSKPPISRSGLDRNNLLRLHT